MSHGHIQSNSAGAAVAGAAVAGSMEIAIFHPYDTVVKRLMSNESRVLVQWGGAYPQFQNLSGVVFADAAGAGWAARVTGLFRGIGFAAMYKIMQRTYKFGGQSTVDNFIQRRWSDQMAQVVGGPAAKPLCSALAGSIMGAGEVAILPLDVLKIKRQTNPQAMANRSVLSILRSEGLKSLYKGAGWTAARNIPGSFCLFGGNAVTKRYAFGLEHGKKATFFQNFAASTVGSVMSILISSPLDVVKTRLQNKEFGSKLTGRQVVSEMLRREGVRGFFKGSLVKTMAVSPKLIFSFTVAQHVAQMLTKDHGPARVAGLPIGLAKDKA